MKNALIFLSVFFIFISSSLSAMTRDETFQKALSGDVYAMFSLGADSYKKIDVDPLYARDAFYWFTKSAKKGYPPAQSALANMYHYGEGTAVDYHKYVFWARKAAENGHSAGMLFLATAYIEGHGVPKNYSEARKWLFKGSDNRQAQYLLGLSYEEGIVFPRDLKKAYGWYSKSMENGVVEARHRLHALCKQSPWACK